MTASTTSPATDAERDRHAYVDGFSLADLERNVADARAALIDVIQTTPLGRALIRYLTAERLRYAEHTFAGQTAMAAGIDPGRLGYDPRFPQQRHLSDAAKLLNDIAAEMAENEERRRVDELHRRYSAAPVVEQHTCAMCQKFVELADLVLWQDGRAFHRDCPKPQLLYTAEQIAESNGAAAKAARWAMGYDN